jgi:SAM-dependent methyltransferase
MPIASQRRGEDERAELFPPELLPLIDDAFVVSCDLIEEYIARLALGVFQSTGLEEACRWEAGATIDQAVARAGLAAAVARVPTAWILAMLISRGWLESIAGVGEDIRYRLARPLPALDPDEIVQAQEAHDPRCMPSYEIMALAAEHYPAVLRGQTPGEQALFGVEGISAWVKYFSNSNPLYAISNLLGAIAAEQALPEGTAAILEIGGGLGSGTEALLDRLDAAARATQVSTYRFTEISALFLKRAQRTLVARYPGCPITFAPLDIDRSFAEGGIAHGTYSLVYGVNVLHVARDLAATLHELRKALKAGGVLVMSECVRPFPGTPLHLEFVFNLLSAFREPLLVSGWRPNGGFLTSEQWTAALEANGFEDILIYPDIATVRSAYPAAIAAAIIARKA